MATWGEMNLGRRKAASESIAKGGQAFLQGAQQLQSSLGQTAQMGYGAWQNQLQRQHEKAMPDIQAEAKINLEEGLLRKRWERLFGSDTPYPGNEKAKEVLDRQTAAAPSPSPIPETVQFPTREFKELPTAQTTTTGDGTKYPNQYAEEITGNKADWQKLKFRENGVEIPYTQAWDPNTKKVRPGVEVDYSALVPGRSEGGYREFMELNKMTPETYQPPGNKPVIPEAAQIPVEAERPATAFRETEIGKKVKPWEREMPGGWGKQLEEHDLGMRIKEAEQTDLWRMRSKEVDQEYPDANQKWKDAETMRRVFGYYYGPDRGGTAKDRAKRAYRGTLEGFLDERASKYISDRPGMVTTKVTEGGTTVRTLVEGKTRQEVVDDLLDYATQRFEKGVTDFYDITQEGRYKELARQLHDNKRGSTEYNQAYGEVKNMLRPLVESTFDKMMAGESDPAKEWEAKDPLGIVSTFDPKLKQRVEATVPRVKQLETQLNNFPMEVQPQVKWEIQEFKNLSSAGAYGRAAEHINAINKYYEMLNKKPNIEKLQSQNTGGRKFELPFMER